MTIAAAEKPAIKTGNVILDMELPLLTADELGKVADKMMMYTRNNAQ